MDTMKQSFRARNTPAETKLNKEATDSPKPSQDIVKNTVSNSTLLDSKSMMTRRFANLFSKALSEARVLRVTSISQVEQGVRFEELIDTTRLECMKILEANSYEV